MNEHINGVDLEKQDVAITQEQDAQQIAPRTALSLEEFRALVGIPQDPASPNAHKILPATIRTTPNTKPRILILFRLLSRPPHHRRSRGVQSSQQQSQTAQGMAEEDEYPSSIFFALIREESDQWRLYHIYNLIVYASLIIQLVIASALIIVGAIPSITPVSGGADTYRAHRISVAILGAATGLLTGVLSLLKGQGLPTRFLQYASRLRQVRERIEFAERTLRANVQGTSVTYTDVLEMWHDFENVINERDMNKPDAWASAAAPTNSKDNSVDRMWHGQTPANPTSGASLPSRQPNATGLITMAHPTH